MKKNCKTCEKEFNTNHGRQQYCDPKCRRKAKHKRRYIRKETAIPRKCKNCQKEFVANSKTNIYCDKKCRKKAENKRRRGERNAKYSKVCPACNTHFEANRKDHVYCKPTCLPSHKQAKKLRKRTKRKCKLSVESWSDIEAFILDRPDGCDLDHIIPLNHPDVCGLHNTWNFQWLSKDDNNLKSNKFDGTNDNLSWKGQLSKK